MKSTLFKAVETTNQHFLWLLQGSDLPPNLSKSEHGLFLGYISTMTNVLSIPDDVAIASFFHPKKRNSLGICWGTVWWSKVTAILVRKTMIFLDDEDIQTWLLKPWIMWS
jgi:hypothetical protein